MRQAEINIVRTNSLSVTARLAILLILGLTVAPAQGQLGPKPILHTPDVIAAAVLPYLACLYAERGLPLLRAADGTQITYDKSTKDCSAARAQAKEDAAKLLQGKTAPDGQSTPAFIDEALNDMDSYVSSLPMPQGGHAHAQQAVIGIPVTIEDEVQPAYKRYDECLKTQVSNSPVTAETVLAQFRLAMNVCASVRDFAVTEASKALAAKGWDETTRLHAAQSTFAKVDQSWLAMGQQFRELLLQKRVQAAAQAEAKPKPPR